MTIETRDNRVFLRAEPGAAIHRVGTPVPSHTVGYSFPVGKDDPDGWEDCELGEPTGEDEATEADKDAALARFGVDINGGYVQ